MTNSKKPMTKTRSKSPSRSRATSVGGARGGTTQKAARLSKPNTRSTTRGGSRSTSRTVSKTVYKDNSSQCTFITSKNTRCRRQKLEGEEHCKYHKDLLKKRGGNIDIPKNAPHIKVHEYDYYKEDPDEFDSTAAYVSSGVWIGSIDSIHDPEFLKRHEIKSILNTSGMEPNARTLDMYKRLGIEYYTISKSEYNPRTRKHKVVKFMSDEPFGLGFTPRDFYKYLHQGVGYMKQAPKPMIVNCFPEDDHQLLTNKGFMFLHEVEEYTKYNDDLLFASYDEKTKKMVYDTFKLVVNPYDTYDMVEFTQKNEERFWNENSDEYGFNDDSEKANPSNRVSIITTPGHRMYVERGLSIEGRKGIYWKRHKVWNEDKTKYRYVKNGYETVEAKDLVSDDERECIKFLGCADNGIEIDSTKSNDEALPFISQLNLDTPEKVSAFLEIYGYWLGDGSVNIRPKESRRSITFSPVKPHDSKWLIKRLNILGDVKHNIYKSNVNKTQKLFDISDKRWISLFHTEYQRKYMHGFKSEEDLLLNEQTHLGKLYENVVYDCDSQILTAKSAKWMCDWVWNLNKEEARCVLSGLRMADGDEANNENAIYTSSTTFRDELMRLSLHAGYSPTFIMKYKKGSVRGVINGKEVVANHDSWRVSYNSNPQYAKPNLRQKQDVKKTTYIGRTWCVTVPHDFIFVRRAHFDKEKKYLTKASRPVLQKNCHAGINRSGSTIAAYLMTKPHPLSYDRAVELLERANRRRNLSVLTNKDFRTSLRYYPMFGGNQKATPQEISRYKAYMSRYE